MGKLVDAVVTFKDLTQDFLVKRKAKKVAESNIQKSKDVSSWNEKVDACECLFRNRNMPMSARAFMYIPLRKPCDHFQSETVCEVGRAIKCEYFEPHKIYVTAIYEYNVSKENLKNFLKKCLDYAFKRYLYKSER